MDTPFLQRCKTMPFYKFCPTPRCAALGIKGGRKRPSPSDHKTKSIHLTPTACTAKRRRPFVGSPKAHMLPLSPIIKAVFPYAAWICRTTAYPRTATHFRFPKQRAAPRSRRTDGKSRAVKNGFRNSETDKTLYRDGTAAARKTSPSGARPPLPPTGKSTPVHLRIHSALPCSFTRFPTVVHIVHRVIHNLRPLCHPHPAQKAHSSAHHLPSGCPSPDSSFRSDSPTKSHSSAATSLLTASATSRNPPWKSGETVTVPRSVRTRTRPVLDAVLFGQRGDARALAVLVVVDRFRLNKEAGQQCGDIIRRDVERLERSKKLEYERRPVQQPRETSGGGPVVSLSGLIIKHDGAALVLQ